MATLTIIRGLPGSGKTTMAKQLQVDTGAPYYEADQYFETSGGAYNFNPAKLHLAHAFCEGRAKTELTAGRNCTISNTARKPKESKTIVKWCQENGHHVKVITAVGNYNNVHSVPAEKMEQMRREMVGHGEFCSILGIGE